MPHKTFFNKPLLISQEEMAMLLGITRSQWSMVVLGERELNAASLNKLSSLITNFNQNVSNESEILTQLNNQNSEKRAVLEKLVEENTFKQLQLQRKLTKMITQFEKAANTLDFVNSLKKSTVNKSILQVLEKKANRVMAKNSVMLQEIDAIQLEVLLYEETLLRNRLEEL